MVYFILLPMIKKLPKKFLFLGALVAIFLLWMVVEPFLLDVKYFNLKNPDIPEDFNNKKIVFVSDIHCGDFFPKYRVKNLIDTINGLHPDIIFLGGDFVQYNDTNIDKCISYFNFQAPLGVYGVLGNHDLRVDKNRGKAIARKLEAKGIRILYNELGEISDNKGKIKILGANYGAPNDEIMDMQAQTAASDFAIMLAHSPDSFEFLNNKKIDLALAGHTHGGQVNFFGLWAPFDHTKFGQIYVRGAKMLNGIPMVISNGVGTTLLPLRFWSIPDIYQINLAKTK